MARREDERKKSLDALARIAYATGGGAPPPPPPLRSPTSSLPAKLPAGALPVRTKTPAPPQPAADPFEGRRAKQEEARQLRERRANELHGNKNLQWRGMGMTDVPSSIRRTGFDRDEPSLSQKVADVLGDAKEKEGRAKARDKGRRAAGGR